MGNKAQGEVNTKGIPYSENEKLPSRKTKSNGKSTKLSNKAIAMLLEIVYDKARDEDGMVPTIDKKYVPIAYNEKSSRDDISNLADVKASEYHKESMHILKPVLLTNKPNLTPIRNNACSATYVDLSSTVKC